MPHLTQVLDGKDAQAADHRHEEEIKDDELAKGRIRQHRTPGHLLRIARLLLARRHLGDASQHEEARRGGKRAQEKDEAILPGIDPAHHEHRRGDERQERPHIHEKLVDGEKAPPHRLGHDLRDPRIHAAEEMPRRRLKKNSAAMSTTIFAVASRKASSGTKAMRKIKNVRAPTLRG